ncbi:sensor domain-containing diguanylate cyclase [Salimicrobium halophilum]|uniref:PAS domain S-box-containing protein/diguanylate cyclase (GGDEF) domain-containing protein n=1 Tax=Salimicrobium halophilum TaxID=86666 RepID=A0A1G8TKF8_9BACI|nr:sensor domain-containing diguanylate cyclase [Salimicrobium halophilum]SDJ41160.1 PAS domain S-box-containing protein/diguanylate cyclase (GGDEF) domain-containing protein [Salimicrobium halophilum]
MNRKNDMNDFIMNQLDATPLTIWLVDENDQVLFVNGDTEKILNATKEEVLDTSITDWIDQMSLEKVDTLLMTAGEDETVETELNLYSKSDEQNSYYAFVKVVAQKQTLYMFIPVSTEYFQITEQLLEINSDFSNLYSELYKKNEIIEQQKQDYYMLSVTDSLTKLFNRRYFYDIVEEEVKNSWKEQRSLSFLMIDINDFKKVNDQYGHHAGDKLLVSIADMLLENLHEEEKAFRFGGDEFLIVLHRSREDSLKWAGHISAIFTTLTSIATLSYGAVEYTGEIEDIPKLLKEADKHMYVFKKNAKGRLEGRKRS